MGVSARRFRGRVHQVVLTDRGPITLLFTESLAKQAGRELSHHAVPIVGEHRNHTEAAAAGATLQKPGGGL